MSVKDGNVNRPLLYFDNTYTGDRWRYGLTYRPITATSLPKGWIIGSDRSSPTYRHGTVDFPFSLTTDQVEAFELEDLGKVRSEKTGAKRIAEPRLEG